MNGIQLNTKTTHVSVIEFEHQNDEHIVTLVDAQGHKIIRGYGTSIADAINDLHHNLI